MQSVTVPVDAEAWLADAIAEATGYRASANPPGSVGGAVPVAHVVQVGCAPATAVSWEHDLSIDVWAGSGDDYGPATDAARAVAAALLALAAGGVAKEPTVTSLYPNPDPRHAGVPRVTVACNLALRGEAI